MTEIAARRRPAALPSPGAAAAPPSAGPACPVAAPRGCTLRRRLGQAWQALRGRSDCDRLRRRIADLEIALDSMNEAITVVDDDLRLVAWNARMTEIFGMGAPVLQPGRRIDEAVADHLRRQGSDEETVEMMRDRIRAGYADD